MVSDRPGVLQQRYGENGNALPDESANVRGARYCRKAVATGVRFSKYGSDERPYSVTGTIQLLSL